MRRHVLFQVHAERVRDAIDVIEISDDMDEDEQVLIREPLRAQSLEVLATCPVRVTRQPLCELHKRAATWAELGFGWVLLYLPSQLGIPTLLTEILPVSFGSVVASVRPGDHGRHHLALASRQARWPVHDLGIELQKRSHNFWPETL